jgi:hypothetical protein
MFNDGNYNKSTISKNQFIQLVKNAEHINSSIGYDSVVKLIKELTDVEVEVCRGRTIINNDELIVGLTLPFRVNEKSKNHIKPTVDDYIYFMASYKLS